MADTETRINPALTPDEWVSVLRGDSLMTTRHSVVDDVRSLPAINDGDGASDLAAAMALANHTLPNSDPRKLTWVTVYCLREAARMLRPHATLGKLDPAWLDRCADAIESLLPPE